MPVFGLAAVNALFADVERRAVAAAATGVRAGVLQGQGIVRGNAAGRPGPRIITGNFNRSIVGDTETNGTTVLGQIGSNAPQAARLEYGFYGTDSLGRNYNQSPYPYLQPSVPAVTAAVESAIANAISGAF